MSATGERIEVVEEERTYRPDTSRSMFKDMVDAERGDYGAKERLTRHAAEAADWMEKRDENAWRAKPNDLEYRVNPSTGSGTGGTFAPPLWIIEQFATFPRAKRILADLVPSFPLPQGVHTVNLPRLTTGNTEQAANDLAPDGSTDIVDAAVASNVVTISGHGDVSLQELDQSPPGAHLDWAFLRDLTEAYDANLEYQLLNGNTSLGQLAGVLNVVPTANKVTYTDGAPKGTAMFPLLGQLPAKIGNTRALPPEYWMMTTSRFSWIGSSEDDQHRPLDITDHDGSGDVDLMAWQILMDDAIPATLGAGANQDVIIAIRPSDGILLESAPHARVHLEVLSGTLQARIQLHHYAAFLFRYPSGIATLTGTGMVVQSGF